MLPHDVTRKSIYIIHYPAHFAVVSSVLRWAQCIALKMRWSLYSIISECGQIAYVHCWYRLRTVHMLQVVLYTVDPCVLIERRQYTVYKWAWTDCLCTLLIQDCPHVASGAAYSRSMCTDREESALTFLVLHWDMVHKNVHSLWSCFTAQLYIRLYSLKMARTGWSPVQF